MALLATRSLATSSRALQDSFSNPHVQLRPLNSCPRESTGPAESSVPEVLGTRLKTCFLISFGQVVALLFERLPFVSPIVTTVYVFQLCFYPVKHSCYTDAKVLLTRVLTVSSGWRMPCGAGGHGLLGLKQTEEPKQLTAMFGPASCWLVTLQFGSFRQIPQSGTGGGGALRINIWLDASR